MRGIFISYRRDDAEGQAGRLFDDLSAHFGRDAVFMDVAGIKKGVDFRRIIDEHVASCGVLLVIIGKRWLTATDSQGRRRLDDPNDFVRLETAAALSRDIPVVPVLVQDAVMPTEQELPDALKELAFRNGTGLTHARWDSDVKLLIEDLKPFLETPAPDSVAGQPAPDLTSVATARGTTPEGDRPARRSLWAAGAVAVVAGVSIVGYHLWQDRPAEPIPPFANARAPQVGAQRGPDSTVVPPLIAARTAPNLAGLQPSVPDPAAEQAKAEQAKAEQAKADQAKADQEKAAKVAAARAAAAAAAARRDADERRRREDVERTAQLAAEQLKRDEEAKRVALEQAEKKRLAAEQAEKERIASEQAAGAKIFAEFATAVIGSRQNNRR